MNRHVQELLDRHFAGTASEEDARSLSAWLCESPGNARLFMLESLAHSALNQHFRGHAAATDEERRRSRRKLFGYLGGAVAACLIIGLLLAVRPWSSGQSFELVSSYEAAWSESSTTPEARVLSSGIIHLRMRSGAEVLVEAPAQFHIEGEALTLHHGRIFARCATEQSRELVVRVADVEVIDLGTEFGVEVDAGIARAVVLEGAIERRSPGGSTVIARAGQTIELKGGTVTATHSLANWRRLARFDLNQPVEARRSWSARIVPMLDDPSLLVAVGSRFETPVDHRSLGLMTGESVPARRADRFGMRSAWHFNGSGEALRFTLDQPLDEVTFAAWVWLESEAVTDQPRHRALVMSDGWGRPGQLHWQVKGRDFRLSYFDEGDGLDPRFAASPDGLIGPGWRQLVTVARRTPQMQVEHYLDGMKVYGRVFDTPAPPLVLGRFRVGGWEPHLTDAPDRTLGGAIDDLMIFARALSADEVRTLYEQSRR